jgi:hypothetical protein
MVDRDDKGVSSRVMSQKSGLSQGSPIHAHAHTYGLDKQIPSMSQTKTKTSEGSWKEDVQGLWKEMKALPGSLAKN